jgi:hypothetical protein
VKLVEPPSCSSLSAIVFIGRDRRGNWVAQEQNGLFGGLFVGRAQAIKYALFENGHHPENIVELAREIELDMRKRISVKPTPATTTAEAARNVRPAGSRPHPSMPRCAANNRN